MIDQAFALTYAIQLLVIGVTLAGIVDLLTTQIIERRRPPLRRLHPARFQPQVVLPSNVPR
jgi:hypothetical protein